jgi:hypothetical protein
MVSVTVEPVPAAQALIDEHGQAERVRQPDRGIQGRVLVPANGVVHPVEDELAVRSDWAVAQAAAALG